MIRELWRDGAVYALGTIVSRGLGLLLLPLYTHTLPPSSFGLLDLIITAGVLVNLIAPLETPQAVARLWNERSEGVPRRRMIGTGFVFAACGYAVFLGAAWAWAGEIASMLGVAANDAPAIRAGAAFIAANGVMLLAQGNFRWALRARAYAWAGAGYSALVLLGLAALLACGGGGVTAVLWLQCAAATVVAIACAWSLRRELEWRIHSDELAAMLRFSLPLVPAGVAVFATLHLHRYVLNALGTLDEVGLFGIASRLAGVVTIVLLGVQSALTPLIYAHHDAADTPPKLARLLEGFWAIALLVCLALAAFGRELLALLTTPDYVNAAPLVVWLAPATLLAQMYIFAPGIALAKKTHWQLALTGISALLGLLLAMLLVPRWQAQGAAASTCAAAALFFAAWLVLGQRLYRLPLRWLPLAGVSVAYIALTATALHLTGWPPGAAASAAKVAVLAAMLMVLWASGVLRPPTVSLLGLPRRDG